MKWLNRMTEGTNYSDKTYEECAALCDASTSCKEFSVDSESLWKNVKKYCKLHGVSGGAKYLGWYQFHKTSSHSCDTHYCESKCQWIEKYSLKYEYSTCRQSYEMKSLTGITTAADCNKACVENPGCVNFAIGRKDYEDTSCKLYNGECSFKYTFWGDLYKAYLGEKTS